MSIREPYRDTNTASFREDVATISSSLFLRKFWRPHFSLTLGLPQLLRSCFKLSRYSSLVNNSYSSLIRWWLSCQLDAILDDSFPILAYLLRFICR